MEAIVAVYSDWGIGKDGTQPITLPEDRRHFAEMTKGAALIVGRRTMEDFPGGRPLKNRVNIVLTSQDVSIEGAIVAHTAAAAAREAAAYERVMVIGGASVYHEFFPRIDKVYVTKITAKPRSDSFFPNLDKDPDWALTEESEHLMSGELHYRFCVYERVGGK